MSLTIAKEFHLPDAADAGVLNMRDAGAIQSITATHLIAAAAGVNRQSGLAGFCRSCGCMGFGELFSKWVKPTFTDWDKLKPGEIVCNACLFCFDDANEPLIRRTGKEKPQRFRNYSHFVAGGEWTPLSKGEKVRMTELLLDGPEVAVVALSGQKHLAFRCPAGWWQIEEHTVRPFVGLLGSDLKVCRELYSGGFSKCEIETGRYQSRRIMEFGLRRWQELEAQIQPLRGSLRLELALFLVQKTKRRRRMKIQQIADGLLWPLWRGIPDGYKRKYARSIWQQFEDQVRSSAYTSSLSRFLENIGRRLNVEWANAEDAALVAVFVQMAPAEAREALNILRSESTAAILLVRLRNEERKAEYLNRQEKKQKEELAAENPPLFTESK